VKRKSRRKNRAYDIGDVPLHVVSRIKGERGTHNQIHIHPLQNAILCHTASVSGCKLVRSRRERRATALISVSTTPGSLSSEPSEIAALPFSNSMRFAPTFGRAATTSAGHWESVPGQTNEADFQARRYQRDWTAEKYRRFDRGERPP
jgi:hypothetical protein